MRDLLVMLSTRYLLGYKRRTLLTQAGIMLGVTLIMSVLLVNKAIVTSYERTVTDLSGKSQIQVSAASGLPEENLAKLAGIPRIKTAVPVVSNSTVLTRNDREGVALISGIDPEKDAQVRTYTIVEGRMIQAEDERALAITTALAETMKARLGDEVELLTVNGSKAYKIVGLLAVSGPAQVSLGQYAAMPIKQAQREFGKEGKYDQIDILLDRDSDADTVKPEIERLLGGQARVGRPADRTRELEDQLNSVRVMLLMSSFIALFAASFIIYTNVRASVEQRRHELSILRAIGMSPRQVVRLVLNEALLMGLIGSALGAVMGVAFSRGMIPLIIDQMLSVYNFTLTDMPVTVAELGLSFVIGCGITLLASYLPARETMRIRPVEGLRAKGDVDAATRPSQWQPIIGVVLVLISVPILLDSRRATPILPTGTISYMAQFVASFIVLLGLSLLTPVILRGTARVSARVMEWLFRTPGRLAADNLARSIHRGSSAVNSLLIAVSMMVAIGGLSYSARQTTVQWMADSLRWDLWVFSSMAGTSSRVAMTEAFGDELRRMDGIELVVPYRFSTVDLGDIRPALWSYDMPAVRQVFKMALDQGKEDEVWRALETGGSIVVSTPIAQSQGYRIGDVVDLKTPSGLQQFRIAGISQEVVPASPGTITMNRADYIRYWNDRTVTSFSMKLKPGTPLEATRQAISKRWGDRYQFQVLSVADMKSKTQQGIDGFWAMSNAMVMMAIFVACLAVFNTMTTSIMERIREIGMLRAIGTSERQVGRMVVLESLLLGLIGGAIGVGSGLALCWAFVKALARNFSTVADFYWPVWPLEAAVVVVLLFIPFTGWLAGRSTRKLELVQALQHEN